MNLSQYKTMAEESGIYRALTVMEKADGSVTVEYLARRMNIPDYSAYEILVKLADRGFVTRKASSDWSKSLSPKFEISLDGISKIKNITEKVSEVIAELL